MEKFKNIVKNILNEELSVSTDVLSATDDVYNAIEKYMVNAKWDKGPGYHSMEFSLGNVINNKYFGHLKLISVNIVNLETYENYVNNSVYFEGNYNQKTRILWLRLPYFNNMLYDKASKPIIAHELEHCYQTYFTLLTDKKRYIEVSNKLMDDYNGDNPVYWLSFCIYFLSKPEINAKCHEFAYDLENTKPCDKDEIKKCSAYKQKEFIVNKVNELYNTDELDIEIALKELNVNKEKIFSHLFKMINYINSKFMKVYQGYIDGLPLSEGYEIREHNLPFGLNIR